MCLTIGYSLWLFDAGVGFVSVLCLCLYFRDRTVLQMRYFDGKQGKGVRWKDVAKGIRGRGDAKDEKFVYRLHNSALLHLDEILGNS